MEIEADMVGSGIKRYLEATARSEEKGLASETSYGAAFVNSHLHAVAAEINKRVDSALSTGQPAGKAYWRALANMDAYVLAFITLRCGIDACITQAKLTELTLSIGRRIEDEVRLRQFEALDEKTFNRAVGKLEQRGATSYRFKLNSLVHTMNHTVEGEANGLTYFKWDLDTRVNIGAVLLDAVICATGHFEKVTDREGKKSYSRIIMSRELEEWITHHKDAVSVLFPVWMPMIIPPRDWTSLKGGGFYSPEAQDSCGFVITKASSNPKAQKKALAGAELGNVYSAINHLQQTSWQVNLTVLDVAQQIWEYGLGTAMPSTARITPPDWPFADDFDKTSATPEQLGEFEIWKMQATIAHTQEKERVGKCALMSRILAMAERFKDTPELFFVWHCDFRGRMYSVASGLAPQSADLGKALLHFGEAKALGSAAGVRWFKIHGANTYGVDKVSYADRVQWVEENKERLCHIAADPISHRAEWGVADKPFQFLAWVLEYAEYCKSPETFRSRLAIAQDGTCNGIQNFSAMLRDSVGGAATNLIDADTPNDIYGEVAKVVIAKLEDSNSPTAAQWLAFGITRSVTKRPVMTLPYGSTQQSCREYLLQSYLEAKSNIFAKEEIIESINYLTKIVWQSIGEVVIAAREAMAWLQTISSILAKKNLPITFTSPSGFVIHQDIKEINVHRVNTVLCGRTRITIGTPTDKIDILRQRNGIAPNFIHSCDAAHLVATVIKAKECGITHIAAIHDDYGVHACDTELFASLIREAFVDQYSDNVLLRLHTELSASNPDIELPLPPEYGTLDITDVLQSKYFFG